MPIPVNEAVVGQTYRVTRANGQTWRGTVEGKTPYSVMFTVLPEDRAVVKANSVSLSTESPGTTLTPSRVSRTAVAKVAEDKNLPPDLERLLKRYGGKTRRSRRRQTRRRN